jgi:hypothetical protein
LTRLLLSLPLLLAACSSPAPNHTGDSGVPVVDTGPFTPDPCKASLTQTADVAVGSGQTFYTPLTDGASLTWEKGPQGGHHVWIAIRDIGLRMQGTVTTVDLDDIEDASKPPVNINHSRLIYDFTKEEGGHCVLPGLRMQLDNAGGVTLESLEGHHIRVTVSLKDPDGATATGSKIIVVSGMLT